MTIDWTLLARYIAPLLVLFMGILINRYLERRPKLISYMAHASAVPIQPPEGVAFNVHTHSIVVRNAGRKAATNVRLGHRHLPSYSVFPSVRYEVTDLPSGGKEIHFPCLVPGEQVNIAYLYYPPVLWSNVNTYTKSDEGFAEIVTALPAPQLPLWVQRLAWLFWAIGAIATLYGLGEVIRHLLR